MNLKKKGRKSTRRSRAENQWQEMLLQLCKVEGRLTMVVALGMGNGTTEGNSTEKQGSVPCRTLHEKWVWYSKPRTRRLPESQFTGLSKSTKPSTRIVMQLISLLLEKARELFSREIKLRTLDWGEVQGGNEKQNSEEEGIQWNELKPHSPLS